MPGLMTLDDLKNAVSDGSIDTVLACIVDMQGRLMGKRFHAVNFVEHSFEETHCCNYLLATDLEMANPDGYKATSWAAGYGDYIMKPDLATIRPVPWLEGTAMVLCDIIDHNTHAPVPHSPRAMLQKQVARLADMGLEAKMATELEFFLFEKGYDDIRRGNYQDLAPISGYNEDYSMLQTTKEEAIMRPLRNHLFGAGIPVENTKGEAECGQEELNIRYGSALACADHHTIAKHATKEIAWQHGHAASFMAKWSGSHVGSATHVHQSLWEGDTPIFYEKSGDHGMSQRMGHYLAGLIKYAPEITYFLAPNINSYKRFSKGTFAPTKTVWSIDNRTAGFRLVGEDTKAVRVECRIGGADLNPYLAQSAMLAAGIKGTEDKLPLPAATMGDIYQNEEAQDIPTTLRAATETLRGSQMLREAMGDDVATHYTRAAEWEQEQYDIAVTDWEIARGFEKS
ncbi:MAG: glutamine synthetase family protein [Pseudomonadota bacterium]